MRTDAGFAEAVAVASAADQVILALGETREMSGEANSRSTLDLPGRQEELIAAIKATGTPFAVVLFSGRPLALENIVGDAPAILQAWFPGVQAGPAVADVVFGKVNPGASSRSRSRAGSARRPSTTTTSARDARATPT